MAVARAGVDPTADRNAVQDALRRAIADCRGYVDRMYDELGRLVTPPFPDREEFGGGVLG
jgi:hypothetical protein